MLVDTSAMLDLLLTFVLILANGDVGPEIRPCVGGEQPGHGLHAAPVVRTEHYEMRGVPIVSDAGAPPLGAQKGVMALRRADTPDRRLHEREVTFSVGGIRVHHTEEIKGADRRLVWREFRPDGARTWVAEWNIETGDSSTTGYGWRRGAHGTLGWSPEASKPACGPLELMDGMRAGRIVTGQAFALVEPAAAALTDVEIVTQDGVLQARRRDGSIVCACPIQSLLRQGEEPASGTPVAAAFNGSAQGPIPGVKGLSFAVGTVLVPLRKDGYARAKKRWFVPTRPAHERLLARIPKRR